METKRQLQLRCQKAVSSDTGFEPPFLIFAVGLHDLMPDAIIKDVVPRLNKLLGRERFLREEFGSLITNLTFTTMWPPSMLYRGASPIEHHAQQLANIVMRFYNKWVLVINGYNRTNLVRFCRGFQCDRGKYKLKLTYIEHDGIYPSSVCCDYLSAAVEKAIPKIKETWGMVDNCKVNEQMLLRESWNPVLQAERIYLRALSGEDTSKRVVNVPFMKPSGEPSTPSKTKMVKVCPTQQKKQASSGYGHMMQSNSTSKHDAHDRIQGYPGVGNTPSEQRESDAMTTVYEIARGCPDYMYEEAKRLVEEFKWQHSQIMWERQAEDFALLTEFRTHLKKIPEPVAAHYDYGNTNLHKIASSRPSHSNNPPSRLQFGDDEPDSGQFYDFNDDSGMNSFPAQWSKCREGQI